MKLTRFSHNGGAPEIGAVTDRGIVPVTRELPRLGGDMTALIAAWPEVAAQVAELAADARSPVDAGARLLAPIERPGKVMAIGLNYADHIEESGLATPEHQLWFAKTPNTIHAPYDPVLIPRVSDQVDYEVELVFVVGKRGRSIAPEHAHEHVFGYCVGNDVSVRDWQLRTTQWVLGKSFDTHGPIGPWITTSDEVPDPHGLAISATVNGETRQSSNTRHLVFDVWQQVAHLSQVMTLEPGDVVFSGTPGGVGVAMQPKRFLKRGDVVRCEISGLGHIENVFEDG